MEPVNLGRFDKSFVVRMIRDFFLSLLLLMFLGIGFAFVMTLYEFERDGKQKTVYAAEQLAADVKSIMLNQGGPVAARTVYPILKRNHQRLGLEIAIVPSPVTISSIKAGFGFEPKGLPPEWPEGGRYHEYTVPLSAEAFCLQCHSKAGINDVLGQVTVRNYFSSHLARWLEDARLTSVTAMVDIILSTIILYILLKVRMEPLLGLRSVVARLAKGGMDLTRRAKVKSEDEFGELALDLNLFLDRICQLVEDLNELLTHETAVNRALSELIVRMDEQTDRVQTQVQDITQRVFANMAHIPPPEEDRATIEAILSALTARAGACGIPEAMLQRLQSVLADYQEALARAQGIFRGYEKLGQGLVDITRDTQAVLHWMGDMKALEERMKDITESGQGLLRRLTLHPETNRED